MKVSKPERPHRSREQPDKSRSPTAVRTNKGNKEQVGRTRQKKYLLETLIVTSEVSLKDPEKLYFEPPKKLNKRRKKVLFLCGIFQQTFPLACKQVPREKRKQSNKKSTQKLAPSTSCFLMPHPATHIGTGRERKGGGRRQATPREPRSRG